MDYLIYLPNILPKEFGVVIILKGGVTVPQTATASQGAPGKEAVLRRKRFIFQLTKALSWEQCSGKFSLKPRICFFYLFVLGPFFVTTVQIEKASNR